MLRNFPSLEKDELSRSGTFKKIAIVTADFTGPVKNGGVGTAYLHLARCLVAAGHEVSVIFAGAQFFSATNFHFWQEYYWREKIKLIYLPEPFMRLQGFDPAKISYATYLFLKEQHFDIIHFPDMHGIGFYSLQAKHMGLSFAKTTICVILHGPTRWHKQGNNELLCTPKELQYDYFERKSIEFADVLISPSQYGLQWAVQEAWRIPERTFVEQYLFPEVAGEVYEELEDGFKEIAFFGRLETRKGIEIFCEALELVPPHLLRDKKVTFLGILGNIQFNPASKYFDERRKKWKFKSSFIHHMSRDEALSYLRVNSVLVVLPSRAETLGYTAIECIGARIPFVASKIEAYEELIDPADHEHVLFDLNAEALAQKIIESLKEKPKEVRYRVSPVETNSRWADWHYRVESPKIEKSRNTKRENELPLISVCVTHRNRPHFLEQALKSLEDQTYTHFEVILMDDASDTKASQLFLNSLENEFSRKEWKIVRGSERQGPAHARNKAASLARGEYLFFMDDDNIAKPEELATFVSVAQKTGADVLTCLFDRFTGFLRNGQPDVESRWLCTGDDLSTGAYYNTFGDMNSFFKRSVFLALGGLFEAKDAAFEDYELFCRAVIKGYKMFAIPEALFFYREHATSYSKKTDPLKTVEMRLKPFSDLFSQHGMKAFFEFTLSMRFQFYPELQQDPLDIPPVFWEERKNVFDTLPEAGSPILTFSKKEDFKRLKGSKKTKIALFKNCADITLKETDSWISIPLPDELPRRVLLEVDLFSSVVGTWRAKFQTLGEKKNTGLHSGRLNVGMNRLKIVFLTFKRGSIELNIDPADHTVVIRKIKVSTLK